MSNPLYSQWKNAQWIAWVLTIVGVIMVGEFGLRRDPVIRAVGCSLALVCSRLAIQQNKLASRSATIWRNYEQWSDDQALRSLCQKQPVKAEDANEETDWQPNVYNWQEAASEAVGFIIVGNSGYGKTSIARFLAGLLTQHQPAHVIVLDPHWNELWRQSELTVVGDFAQIEQTLSDLLNELATRRDRQKLRQPLGEPILVIADEIGACLDAAEFNSKTAMKALRRIGAEGRKFGITLIGINHSSSEEDMGISAQMRNNYVLVNVGAAARNRARLIGKQWMEYVQGLAYPCLISGAVEDAIAAHPTHGSYATFRKQGNAPQNLLPIRQLSGSFLEGAISGATHRTHSAPGATHSTDDRTYLERCLQQPSNDSGAIDSTPTAPQDSPSLDRGDMGESEGAESGAEFEIADQMLRSLILHYRQQGIKNQDAVIEAVWGIKKGSGNPRYLKARERYQQVCKRFNL